MSITFSKSFKALEDERTRHHCRGDLKIKRLVKSDENFFQRTTQLYNVVKRNIQEFEGKLNKHTNIKAYWHLLKTQFNPNKQMLLAYNLQK